MTDKKEKKAKKKLITRRRFLVGLAGLGVAGGCGGYTRFVEPGWLELRAVDVRLEKRPPSGPLRILHLSDLHASSMVPLELIDAAITMGLATRPDLICLTGDYITRRTFDPVAYPKVLQRLPDAAPTYAVMGNHDGGDWIYERRGGFPDLEVAFKLLRDARIECLHNRSQRITVRGHELTLVGVGDILSRDADAPVAFEGVSEEETVPILLLSHNPDSKGLFRNYPWDLMLCGHSHGGQIVVPLLGPPYCGLGDRRFTHGLNPWRDRLIYTTRGVGNVKGIRFNCRPEVTVLNLA